MSETAAHMLQTRPEDRVSIVHRVAYGFGALINNFLGTAVGALMVVLNLGLGMNPALVGLLGLLPRLFDAFTDPLIGYLSDKTRTRWGRRRPYIFVGAILTGLAYMVLWQLPAGQSETFYFYYFLFASLGFYLCYTIFATPWTALGYELTPDYNERSRLMGTQFLFGQLAYLLTPWLLPLVQNENLFSDMRDGVATTAIWFGLAVMVLGVVPAIFLRERQIARVDEKHETFVQRMADFFKGVAQTLTFKPFLKLCLATFLVFNGFILISAFQVYVLIYYVYGGDIEAGSYLAGYLGTAGFAISLPIIAFVTWLATKIGKRKALIFSISMAIVGYVLKWFFYSQTAPFLILVASPFLAFGLGGLFTVMPAMIADVVDLDELETSERREGMFGSVYWWIVKLGLAAALGLGGVLLNMTGFDVALEGNQTESTLLWLRIVDCFLPIGFYLVAIWAVFSYDLTPEKAEDVRRELETRRGKAVLTNPQTSTG